jgi:hypothetical protein
MELKLAKCPKLIVKHSCARHFVSPSFSLSCYIASLVATSPKVADIISTQLVRQEPISKHTRKPLFLYLYAIGFIIWFISAWSV